MKKLMLTALLMSLTGLSYANCGNGPNDNGNGCSGNEGPQGPAGLNGTNGKDGANGKDAQVNRHFSESNLVADTAVRLYDGKRVQWQAFNTYAFGRHHSDDVFGDGHNMQYGVRFVYKLGSSYEERRIAELEKMIKTLKAK